LARACAVAAIPAEPAVSGAWAGMTRSADPAPLTVLAVISTRPAPRLRVWGWASASAPGMAPPLSFRARDPGPVRPGSSQGSWILNRFGGLSTLQQWPGAAQF